MHNIISRKNLVALLKCVPLCPNQIWDIYAYRTVRFHSNSQLSSKEIFRAPCGQVQRQDSTTIDLCMSLFSWAKFRSTKVPFFQVVAVHIVFLILKRNLPISSFVASLSYDETFSFQRIDMGLYLPF